MKAFTDISQIQLIKAHKTTEISLKDNLCSHIFPSYKVLSLFSGIGGLCHHGIEMASLSHNFQVKQFVEISDYSQSRLRYEQPTIPIHPDITTYHSGRAPLTATSE